MNVEKALRFSTPNPARNPKMLKRRISCISAFSTCTDQFGNDLSIASSTASRTSTISQFGLSLKARQKELTKRLKRGRKKRRKLAKTDIVEYEHEHVYDAVPREENKSESSSRIVREKEDLLFEEYDLVVWEATPEKKKKSFFHFLKFSSKK